MKGNTEGKGYIWIKGKKEKAPWTGNYDPWLLNEFNYKIIGHKKDGVPIVEKEEVPREERIQASIMVDAFGQHLAEEEFNKKFLKT